MIQISCLFSLPLGKKAKKKKKSLILTSALPLLITGAAIP